MNIEEKIKSMSIGDLEAVLEAANNLYRSSDMSLLNDDDLIYGVQYSEWIEAVYSELNLRKEKHCEEQNNTKGT